MTNEQIDLLVAKRIMGWKQGARYWTGRGKSRRFEGWRPKDGRYPFLVWNTVFYRKGRPGVGWRPTTDMNQAEMVINKFIRRGTQRGLVNCRGRYYAWTCYWKGTSGEGVAPHLGQAICLAALQAKGVIPGGRKP